MIIIDNAETSFIPSPMGWIRKAIRVRVTDFVTATLSYPAPTDLPTYLPTYRAQPPTAQPTYLPRGGARSRAT